MVMTQVERLQAVSCRLLHGFCCRTFDMILSLVHASVNTVLAVGLTVCTALALKLCMICFLLLTCWATGTQCV